MVYMGVGVAYNRIYGDDVKAGAAACVPYWLTPSNGL